MTDPRQLMHLVLDGEADAAQRQTLDALLRDDAALRAEFEALSRLWDGLAAVPAQHPPEGLVARVTAALPPAPSSLEKSSQPFAGRRVFAASTNPRHPSAPSRSLPMATAHRSSASKSWIVAGVAVAALVAVWQLGFDGWPRKEDVSGTVMPAERYRAPQPGAAEIKLGDTSLAQLMQDDTFMRIVRDPQVRAMVQDTEFQAIAKALRENPEAARVLADKSVAEFVLRQQAQAKVTVELAAASHAMDRAAAAAKALSTDADLQRLSVQHAELGKYLLLSQEASRFAAAGAEQAQRFMMGAELQAYISRLAEAQKMMLARPDLSKAFMEQQARADLVNAQKLAMERSLLAIEAAKVMGASSEAMKAMTASAQVADRLFTDRAAVSLMMNNAQAARAVAQHGQAAQLLMANPQLGKMLLASPDATRQVMERAELNKAASN